MVENVRTTLHCGAFALPLLPWKRYNKFPSVVSVAVSVGNGEGFSVAVEIKHRFFLALLSSCKISHTAVNNKFYVSTLRSRVQKFPA